MTIKEQAQIVKKNVYLPKYFYDVIVNNKESYFSALEPVDFEAKPTACCPLHDESTPSFRYYDETNTFFCFGCRKGGDVIKLHMEFVYALSSQTISYEDAVKFLYERYILNKETVRAGFTSTVKEYMSEVLEIAKYAAYIKRLEYSVAVDKALSLNQKRKVWNYMDNLTNLISVNRANATEAKNELEKYYNIIRKEET